jgi:L-asparaginase
MKIRLISTGGTILSVPGEHGLAPTGDADRIVRDLESRFPGHDFSLEILMRLDSSNIQPEQWCEIASAAYSSLSDSDGVIIMHGTDTMAYTSSALGFMLRCIKKPVTLTGAQIPSDDPTSDAASNLSLAVATVENGIKGVTVSFGNVVINGVRAVKTSTSDMNAFESVGVPPMAALTAFGLEVSRRATYKRAFPPSLENHVCPDVFLLKLAPGINPAIFDVLAGMGCKGIVVESFGAGNVPSAGRDIAQGVRRSVRRGIPVVARSQCLRGKVDLAVYETGMAMRDAGAISAGDMTTEAAVAKLMWTLGETGDMREIERVFLTDCAGEISEGAAG